MSQSSIFSHTQYLRALVAMCETKIYIAQKILGVKLQTWITYRLISSGLFEYIQRVRISLMQRSLVDDRTGGWMILIVVT